jgi:hypothetical protein
MVYEKVESDDDFKKSFLGPMAVDQQIRQAISTCWLMFPREKRSAKSVEEEISRLVSRALKDFREDAQAFGVDDDES